MKPIYLEPDEEITSVIDKISAENEAKLAIVVPKNSTLFQSLVNLKLLSKEAKRLNKHVAVISGNKVGQRLAKQVGIETYATLGPVKAVHPDTSPSMKSAEHIEETLPDGIKVHRYVPPTPLVEEGEKRSVGEEVDFTAEKPEIVTRPPIADVEPSVSVSPATQQDKVERVVPATEILNEADTSDAPAIVHERIEKSPDKPEEKEASLNPPVEKQEELPAIASIGGYQRRTASDRPLRVPWRSVVAAAAVLLISFGVLYAFLPKAKVTVTLPARALSKTLVLNAKTVNDAAEDTIAGNLLTVEKSITKTVTATGKKDVGTRSTGTVAIKNCEDTDSHTVPAGSKLSSGGKTFLSASTVTIPAGSFTSGGTVCKSSSVSVNVTAEQSGEAYNLSNATFTVSGLSSRISGSGSTSGGTTKQVTVLSESDVSKVYQEAETAAAEEAIKELRVKADKQTLLEEAIEKEVKQKSVNKAVGAETANATATLTVAVSTIVFDSAQVEEKALQALEKDLEPSQQLIIPDGQKPTLVFKELNDDNSTLNIEASAQGYAVTKVTKSEMRQVIQHKSLAQAERVLKDKYQAKEVAIEVSPSWWIKRLPMLGQAITVEYGFDEVSGT